MQAGMFWGKGRKGGVQSKRHLESWKKLRIDKQTEEQRTKCTRIENEKKKKQTQTLQPQGIGAADTAAMAQEKKN